MEAVRGVTVVFALCLLASAFAVDTTSAGLKPNCQAVTIYNSSYPTAGLHVDFVTVLSKNSSDVNECIALCCLQGAEKCQFAWKFQSNCLAIACLDVTKCSPETGNNRDMTYISVSFTPATEEPFVPTGTAAPTTLVLPATTTTPTEVSKEASPSDSEPTQTPAFTVKIKAEMDIYGSDATLLAVLVKEPSYTYAYNWEQVDGPSEVTTTETSKKIITLHSLIRGVYTIKLTVERSDGETSHASHTLVVHTQSSSNQPPSPVILPSTSVELRMPSNSVTFDASKSTDDLGEKNLQFEWTLLKKPSSFKPKGLAAVGPKLELHDLVTGFYQIRLGVTDEDGARSFADANVTVLSDQDLRPMVITEGPDVVRLPENEAFLMGNRSYDDKGIVQYSWTQTSGPKADLNGDNTAVLHVTNLQEGHYSFKLTVTDTAGQSSSNDVAVEVQADQEASTLPAPVGDKLFVKAGGNVSVYLPDTSVTILGSANPDATSLLWKRIRGPSDIKLQGADTLHLTISGLHLDGSNPTVYQFSLTATNKIKQTVTDTAFVFLYNRKTDAKIPPINSKSGSNTTQGNNDDVTIILPEDSVTLAARLPDHGGAGAEPVQYKWSRSDTSPAIGRVAYGSDTTPNLQLTGLTNGTYVFSVSTANAAGQWTERTRVVLRVKENPFSKALVQMVLNANAATFTQADLMDVSAMLKATLNHAEIVVQKVVDVPPNVMIEFYAINEFGEPMNGSDVQSKLTENGASFSLSPQYMVLEVETKVCQNLCSDHGFCDPRTKKCVCNIFWVENPFKSRIGRKISNCEWSVFYIMLVVIGSTIAVSCLLWICCCCCIKSRNNARKRRIRYAILAHKDNEENLHMLPKGEYTAGYTQTSLMVSESGEEEEIVFDAVKAKKSSRKPANGAIPQSNPAQRDKIPNRSETKSV